MKINISKVTVAGEERWRLDYVQGGRRFRKLHDSHAAVLEAKRELLQGHESSGDELARFSADDRSAVLAAWHLAKAKNLDLLDCVQYRVMHPPKVSGSIRLSDAYPIFLDAKRKQGCRPSTLQNIRNYVSTFVKPRGEMAVDEAKSQDVEQHINRYPNPRSRNGVHSYMSAFFSYCVKQRWCQFNPCREIEYAKIDQAAPVIFTPEEVRVLLAESPRPLLPYFVLAVFCGIRPNEIYRLTWDKVNLEERHVRIDGADSKVRRRRMVAIPENAVAWLRVAGRPKKETIIPYHERTMMRLVRETARYARLKWGSDILRHTAASMWLAKERDPGKVSYQLGNSPAILMSHYNGLATEQQAVEFFNIMPFSTVAAASA